MTIEYIILFLIVFIAIIKLYKKKSKNEFKYASIEDEYIEPKVIENIITNEECNYILDKSKDLFRESSILSGKDTTIRKSYTCWLEKNDPVIKKILNRVCSKLKQKFENCEDLQIVKYDENGYYREHHDSCCDDNEHCKEFIKRGGQRKITIVIYLNDDFEEGTTYFPKLDKHYKAPKNGGLLFYSLSKKRNICHPKALHTGTDVKKGQKYIANIWIREDKFI